MKITEEQKTHTSFLFGKLKGFNNRESNRLALLIPQSIGIKEINPVVLTAYVAFCKEPRIDRNHCQYKVVKDGVEVFSRSKLVMEYEKHRKLFVALCKLRNGIIISNNVDSVALSVLQEMNISDATNITLPEKMRFMELLSNKVKL